jgi:hypothetical protein
MSRYKFDEVETDEDDQISDSGHRQFSKRPVDQPRWSPIRRKDKLRQEEGVKPKAKRNHKKIQHKIKYDWQGE